jgi:hypothetical protein
VAGPGISENSQSWPDQQRSAWQFKHRTDVFDRQKLTPIWSRFGLNNVSAGFHHIPVISQPRAGGHFRRQGGTFAEGNGAVAAVGTGRVRDCISLADANYGARCNFSIRRFDSDFSDQTLHLVRIDCGFFRATDVPCLEPSSIASRETPTGPVTAGVNRPPRATAKYYEE